MGVVADYMDRRLGSELDKRGVVVWYDATGTCVVAFAGSYYEILRTCEEALGEAERSRLLVYLPGEPHFERLSPLRELECIGGDKEPFQRDLAQIARLGFQSAGLPDSEIDELLGVENVTLHYLDQVQVADGDGVSPLAPVFGSGREIDVVPLFLADPEKRGQATQKGLLHKIAELVRTGLGLSLESTDDVEVMAKWLARTLLAAEFRSDLKGPAPVQISQLSTPSTEEHKNRISTICVRLRREFAAEYEELARNVERDLGLAGAEVDPLTLGQIDTFPFEEARLLEACDRLLAQDKPQEALEIVEARATSFWTSVVRHPARHAAWKACAELAKLARHIAEVEDEFKNPPKLPQKWVEAYAAEGGWHRIDQCFRRARSLLSHMEDDSVLEEGASHVFESYEELLERVCTGFIESLAWAGFEVPGVLQQTEVFTQRLGRPTQPVAYFLVDSMRFEMAAELLELLESQYATALTLQPALAAIPTITPVGMAALLPGAERSFSIRQASGHIVGAIGGEALPSAEKRVDHAMAQVPGVCDLRLDDIITELKPKKLRQLVEEAPIVFVRSTEIDAAGESLSSGLAKKVMGTVLQDIRQAALKLAAAGITRFVITADHGHLFGSRRGDDMKIDPPEGGRTVEVHRRCWIGRGGSTPTACLRVAGRDLAYDTDLELVFPKGLGVFKGGGDLAYHHGGLSLQELVIPVLTFELESPAVKKRLPAEQVILEGVPSRVTNRIFSVTVAPCQADVEARRMRVIALANDDRRTVGQACFAEAGFDEASRTVTFEPGEARAIAVGIQLDDDEVRELRVVVVEAGTGRTLKDTQPIPVDLVR